MIRELWVDGERKERWSDTSRKVTTWDDTGKVELHRGFNNEEKHAIAQGIRFWHALREAS